MLKRSLGLAVFGIALLCGQLQAQTLDDSIKNAASELSGNLAEGSIVAVISFQSQSTRLADYTIDELNTALVKIGKLRPVERRRLDSIRGELGFNVSGEVSDESAQSIGQLLGAQNIIIGSIEIIGSVYRLRFQAITTETATIQYVFSENITNDRVLESLLRETNYLVDFTFQERLRASALNLAFGAGSFFVERDGLGGGITAALEGLGTLIIITGLSYDYDIGAGVVIYVGGAIYGILRAQTRHKPGSQIAVHPFDRLGIDLVSTANDSPGLKISYAWRF